MYLLSWSEENNVLEASLGGRVTASEIDVLASDVSEFLADLSQDSFYVLFDYSGVKHLDGDAVMSLNELKDICLSSGALQLVSVPANNEMRIAHTTTRLQAVMEGSERFVTCAAEAKFAAVRSSSLQIAA